MVNFCPAVYLFLVADVNIVIKDTSKIPLGDSTLFNDRFCQQIYAYYSDYFFSFENVKALFILLCMMNRQIFHI